MQEATVSEKGYERFSVLHRLLHLVVMAGFTGLALTGLSLAFSSQSWARGVMWVLGGPEKAGSLHRFLAVVTYACVVTHLIWFFYLKVILRGSWTGPHSLLPRLEDVKDFGQHLSYFLGVRKDTPRFNKFSYVEKMDYWAFFIGMNTMGVTGLFLWSPETASRLLPGYFVNIAQVLHLYEAILAVSIKLVIHIAVNHLRPSGYPIDKSIFSGFTSQEAMEVEHPGQWANVAHPAEALEKPPLRAKKLGIS